MDVLCPWLTNKGRIVTPLAAATPHDSVTEDGTKSLPCGVSASIFHSILPREADKFHVHRKSVLTILRLIRK